MPKISKQLIRVNDQDELDERFEININYATDFGFWAQVPEGFDEKFDSLSEKDLKNFSATKKQRFKYKTGIQDKRVIYGNSETDVLESMKAILLKFLKMEVKKEPVIVIYFGNEKDNDQNDKKGLPKRGLTLSATYCHKVSTKGAKDKFYQYSESEWFGETRKTRSEIDVTGWRRDAIIIPDTEENRQFIETLHAALETLVNKLEKFTKTSENMLNLIASKQKLIA